MNKFSFSRDIKLENLLLTEDFNVKLCDLGSASTKQHYPDQNWSMNQRTLLEDELAKYSTPMYRAPEMLDTWSNFPVNQVTLLFFSVNYFLKLYDFRVLTFGQRG